MSGLCLVFSEHMSGLCFAQMYIRSLSSFCSIVCWVFICSCWAFVLFSPSICRVIILLECISGLCLHFIWLYIESLFTQVYVGSLSSFFLSICLVFIFILSERMVGFYFIRMYVWSSSLFCPKVFRVFILSKRISGLYLHFVRAYAGLYFAQPYVRFLSLFCLRIYWVFVFILSERVSVFFFFFWFLEYEWNSPMFLFLRYAFLPIFFSTTRQIY